MKEEVLFKKTPFGGFDRQSVINYIQQLKKTQQEYKNIISDKDRLVKTLTEEKNELKERSEKAEKKIEELNMKCSEAEENAKKMRAKYEMLEKQLPKADLVVCCLPETPLTVGLFSKERIALMKQNALFVNVGRGSLVNEKALVDALEQKRISGAILDVFREEPLPKSSPLWSLPNVFITPHISGKSFNHSPVIERKIAEICVENINRFIDGKQPKNLIRREIGYAENL